MNTRKIGYVATTALIVLAFAGSGVANLLRHPHIATDMTAMGYPVFFMSILGTWKVLGAAAIALPGMPRIKEWAYAGMVFDLTGAALSRGLGGFGVDHIVPPLILCGVVLGSWALRPASRRLAHGQPTPRGVLFEHPLQERPDASFVRP
jgi:uncharacterized membrane protein YphA (DoxX/SURF4 family)